MHHPLWNEGETWSKFKPLFGKRPASFYAGHYHSYKKSIVDSANCYVLATTGGGSGLRGPAFGEFDHFAWITMTRKGPVMANLMLNGIYDDSLGGALLAANNRKSIINTLKPKSVQISSIQYSSTKKSVDSLEVRVTNDADLPMKLELKILEHSQLQSEPGFIAEVVNPNSVYIRKIKLTIRDQKNMLGEIEPLTIRYALEFEQTDASGDTPRSLARIEGERIAFVVKPLLISKAKKEKTIDANLSDWTSLPFKCDIPAIIGFNKNSWKGPQDGSFSFGVESDSKNLYVAIEAVDDSITQSPDSAKAWYQDGLEFRLDARPDPERSQGKGKNQGIDYLMISLCPRDSVQQSIWYSAGELPKGIKLAGIRKSGKIIAEISIPNSYLDSVQSAQLDSSVGTNKKPWQALRLNFSFGDFDGEARDRKNAAQLQWRPDWRSEDSFDGSGTFVR